MGVIGKGGGLLDSSMMELWRELVDKKRWITGNPMEDKQEVERGHRKSEGVWDAGGLI